MTAPMPLEGVRVIDLTRATAGPFCTRLLADYGADVIKIEPPEGDPARRVPPFAGDEPGPERSGLFLFLNTNKRSVVLDLKTEAGRRDLLRLVRGAGAVVENFRPGTLDRLGLGYGALRAANPRVVLTSISNFGQDGPYRGYEATDLTLFAMGGPMSAQGDADLEPVKTAGRMTGYHAGYAGALATAIALHAAAGRGEGEHVDLSIFETAAHSIDARLAQLMGHQYSGRIAQRSSVVSQVGSGVFPCADGFFLYSAGPSRLDRTIRMIGREDLLEQPEWATVAARSAPERIEEFGLHLLPWSLERTKSEIRAACEEHGVLGGPLNTVADLLADPNFTERGFFQTIDHPSTGPIVYPGYHFALHREDAPMPPRRRAPLLGEHTAEVLGALPPGGPAAAPEPGAAPEPEPETEPDPGEPAAPAVVRGGDRPPLEGLRVIDFTVVWAGPYATMHLAEWGAEVIRVESTHFAPSTSRGFLVRPPREMAVAVGPTNIAYPDDEPGERPWNRWSGFTHHARNKRSFTVDLARPEGQEVLDRLIERSDGLIENNLPPNIERSGVTWERLSRVNPRIVMVRAPGFGIAGPYRRYRTFGNHMEALCGHPVIRAYPGRSLEYAPGGVPSDAASGVGSAFAFMLGLRQRELTGKGLLIELATAENFVGLIGEFVMDHAMNGRLWEHMGNGHFFLAPHNVYRCRGLDRWAAITVRDEREWRALCEAMRRPELASDPRFATMAGRFARREELDAEIGAWTAPRDAYWVMGRLQAAGVPAGVVMNEADVYDDRQLEARGFFQTVANPETGVQRQVGRAWKASRSPGFAFRHAPHLGQDNEYVYREVLGYTAAEYRRFEEQGHIGTEYDPGIP